MSSNRQQIVEELHGWADLDLDSSEFDEASVREKSPELHAQAVEAFGSWSAALGAALTSLMQIFNQPTSSADTGGGRVERKALPVPDSRVVGEDSTREGLVVREDGAVTRVGLAAFFGSLDGTLRDLPEGLDADIVGFIPGESDASLGILSRDGHLVSMLREQFPSFSLTGRWAGRKSEDEDGPVGWADAILRNRIRRYERIYFFTEQGQVKASEASEYAKRLDSDGVSGIIVKPGDRAITTCGGGKRDNICLASSMGKAIVFEPGELRTQGLKAQGVRGISLDEGARVCGAFVLQDHDFFALCTAQGYAKLLDPDEFRTQGRSGAGLQTCRLGSDDEVTVFAPVNPDEDILVFTSARRFARVPAYALYQMGRSARGESLLDLAPGERVVGGRIVAPGDFQGAEEGDELA